jgi:hypothetical protein
VGRVDSYTTEESPSDMERSIRRQINSSESRGSINSSPRQDLGGAPGWGHASEGRRQYLLLLQCLLFLVLQSNELLDPNFQDQFFFTIF